ncbi:hypothetical lipoprotein [Metamycoplasma arthritidis]|nr:hypothetical lipoprotein [Metamycoplasma arthritidis]
MNKFFLSLGAVSLVGLSLLIALSCQPGYLKKYNSALAKNEKARKQLEQNKKIPSNFESYKATIEAELKAKLDGISDATQIAKIYDEFTNKINDSTSQINSSLRQAD